MKIRMWDKISSTYLHTDMLYIIANCTNYIARENYIEIDCGIKTPYSADSTIEFDVIIEQCANVKDCITKKDIYVGDIVSFCKYNDNNLIVNGVVGFCKTENSFIIESFNKEENLKGRYYLTVDRKYKKIGNIHKDSNLLDNAN